MVTSRRKEMIGSVIPFPGAGDPRHLSGITISRSRGSQRISVFGIQLPERRGWSACWKSCEPNSLLTRSFEAGSTIAGDSIALRCTCRYSNWTKRWCVWRHRKQEPSPSSTMCTSMGRPVVPACSGAVRSLADGKRRYCCGSRMNGDVHVRF